MTDKEKLDAIRAEIHRLVDVRGYDRRMANDLFAFMNSLPNEPVNEDLGKASKEWLQPQLDHSYADYGEGKMMELTHFDGYAMLDAIEFGAKWKEEQFEKNRLAHCDAQTEEEAEIERNFVTDIIENEHRQPTFDDAIKYGMRLQKAKDKETIETAIHHAYHNGRLEMKEQMMAKLRKWVASKDERDSFTFGYIDRHFDELLKEAIKYE